MSSSSLREFHETFVKGIGPGEPVIPEMYLLGYFANEVLLALEMTSPKVHIRSIALKHIYEKRNAYEYDIILDNLVTILEFPDFIYRNSDIKKADFVFVKEIDESLFACLLKSNAHPEVGQEITVVVSAFKTTETYLHKFELIQSWKDGTPSS